MRVGWVCVNYRTHEETIRLAGSISSHQVSGMDLRLFVVDNSPEEPDRAFLACLANLLLSVQVIHSGSNLGYFGAIRHAFQVAGDWLDAADWVVVSNVDMELRSDAFLKDLAERIPSPSCAVIAPAIFSKRDGRDINPKIMERPSRIRMAFLALMFSNYLFLIFYEMLSRLQYSLKSKKNNMRIKPEVGPASIYAPHGACIILGRTYFQSGGNLDFPQFLFGEEIFIGEMARTLGIGVAYIPSLEIWDDEHASTGLWRNRLIASYLSDSARYVYKTYWASEGHPPRSLRG